ncbi:peptidylprolyl isomerase [Neptunomonas sp.]|uniref:peptidylprolyl isomerase n=1 Tax=Neptunomonas sp. TaxID=1971898 RepID=UPI0025DBD740|nr:peptidylprolyl isomerase [Neptunomonas sp.]
MINSNLMKIRNFSLAALGTLFLSSHLHAAPIKLDSVVAIVNDDIVLESEFKQRIQIIRDQLTTRKQRIPPDNILLPQVLDRLVLDNILLQLATRQGIRVTDRQLNDAVNNIASRNGMTLDQFRGALIAEGQDYTAAREQIRREMLIAQVQQSNVSRRIRVSDQEIKNFLKSDAATINQTELLISVILVGIPEQASSTQIQAAQAKANSIHQTLMDKADFAETAIATSSAPNALNGGDLGWRKSNELPEALTSIVGDMQPGDISSPMKAPTGFYIIQLRDKRGGKPQLVNQTKVRHILLKPSEIRTPAQTKKLIERLHKRLQQGESFAELAKELSDDPASGSEGGDLSWTSPGQMVPEFDQVVARTSINEISSPFESRFGWHILEVQDRRTQDMGDKILESQAKATISKRKFTEELGNWVREIRSAAYVEIKQ